MVTKKNNGFFFSKLDITLILLYSLIKSELLFNISELMQ